MSPPNEFELIAGIKKKFASLDPGLVYGMGDDAAIIAPTQGAQLLFSTDALVEGVHFLTSKITPHQLGRKAMAVNLSDIAAMGGTPKYFLAAIAAPKTIEPDWIENFLEGAIDFAKKYPVALIGGDISRSLEGISLSITIIGEVESGGAIPRNSANIGDFIFVTGFLGDSGAGLELLLSGESPDGEKNKLIRRHLEPEARIDCGRFLSKNRLASAAMDLSDGLSSDLRHLCEASEVGAVLYEDKLPLSEELTRWSSQLENDNRHYALNSGEDYELLFTVPKEKKEAIIEQWPSDFPPLSEIGEIVKKNQNITIVNSDGTRQPLALGGFDHFKNP